MIEVTKDESSIQYNQFGIKEMQNSSTEGKKRYTIRISR